MHEEENGCTVIHSHPHLQNGMHTHMHTPTSPLHIHTRTCSSKMWVCGVKEVCYTHTHTHARMHAHAHTHNHAYTHALAAPRCRCVRWRRVAARWCLERSGGSGEWGWPLSFCALLRAFQQQCGLHTRKILYIHICCIL